jgi:hypothetical protein
MYKIIDIFDNFYTRDEFDKVLKDSKSLKYFKSYQPNEYYYPNRLKAHPCHQTNVLTEQHKTYQILKNKLIHQLNIPVKNIKTFFRKTFSKEMKKSPSIEGIKHQDDGTYDLAAIVYLNTQSIKGGTNIFSDHQYQIEPDIIVGSKINRLIIYNASTFHSANTDLLDKTRIIQTIFVKVIK